MQWWSGISLRAKITGLTVVVLTLGLLALGLGVVTVLRSYLIDDADRQVTQAISIISPQTINGDQSARVTGFAIAHLNANGTLIQANPTWRESRPLLRPSQLEQYRGRGSEVFTLTGANGNAAFRIAVKDLGDGTVVAVALPFTSVNRLIAQLFTLFYVFGIAVILLGAVLARVLVASTFTPLKRVERTAAAIADGDFGQRLEHATPNTEVGRLNRSLNRMLNRIDSALADRARTIDQMRRFVGDASHELRTPLVSVRGYAELYRMGALQTPEEVAQAMDRIEREAIRLGSLVGDLLALARLDQANKEVVHKPVELLPLAHDAALDARALAPKRLIQVVNHPYPEQAAQAVEVLVPVRPTPTSQHAIFKRKKSETGHIPVVQQVAPEHTEAAVVSANEDQLRQVLANLIGNAIRFTPDDSPIEISVSVDHGRHQAILEIIDHGEGIPAQVREKIFERFWRADSSRARDRGGSGLGLSIVQAIIEAHNGSIGVRETPGGGATFRVTLPLLDGEEYQAKPEAAGADL